MRFTILASGSKGNCTLVEGEGTKILIDCGISGRAVKTGLAAAGTTLDQISGVLVTHTHSDHIKGIKAVRDLPLFAPCEIKERYDERIVTPYVSFEIGSFVITPVKLSHDAPECVGYIIECGDEKLVSITDTGYISAMNEEMIRNADYYIFEANHDVGMLMETDRPAYLKARILSDSGHMNNEDAGYVLSRVTGPSTREIVLAHLSEEANDPGLAYDVVYGILAENGVDLHRVLLRCASQHEALQGGHL